MKEYYVTATLVTEPNVWQTYGRADVHAVVVAPKAAYAEEQFVENMAAIWKRELTNVLAMEGVPKALDEKDVPVWTWEA